MRYRVRWDHRTGEKYYLTEDGRRTTPSGKTNNRSDLPAPTVMGDIAEFVSPVHNGLISSRSSLRDHERDYGVRQVGDRKTVSDFDNDVPEPEVSERLNPLKVDVEMNWEEPT